MLDTFINKKTASSEPNIVTELQEVQTKSQGPESQSEATELEQPKPKVEIQEKENTIHSKSKIPVLAKYVRRHHTPDQNIRDKLEGTMTRSKLKGICLLAEFEHRSVKDALKNESWIEAMNEQIE